MKFQFAVTLLLCLTVFTIIITLSEARRPKRPILVDVYYEAFNNDSRDYFYGMLETTYPSLVEQGIDMHVKLIPYGNAKTYGKPGHYEFYCENGPDECKANIIQACAIELFNDTLASFQFVACTMDNMGAAKIIELCTNSTDLQRKIGWCADGPMGKYLEFKMGELTRALYPPLQLLPWTTMNGRGSRKISEGAIVYLLAELCKFYKRELEDIELC